MRGARTHDGVRDVPAAGSLASVLGDVATELRALRQAIEQQIADRGISR
jgi:hypothetical protein